MASDRLGFDSFNPALFRPLGLTYAARIPLAPWRLIFDL